MSHRESRPGRELLLHAALSIAAHGWCVFPCSPRSKHPALRENWQQLATTDPACIYRWWHHPPYNIGLACGPARLVCSTSTFLATAPTLASIGYPLSTIEQAIAEGVPYTGEPPLDANRDDVSTTTIEADADEASADADTAS